MGSTPSNVLRHAGHARRRPQSESRGAIVARGPGDAARAVFRITHFSTRFPRAPRVLRRFSSVTSIDPVGPPVARLYAVGLAQNRLRWSTVHHESTLLSLSVPRAAVADAWRNRGLAVCKTLAMSKTLCVQAVRAA